LHLGIEQRDPVDMSAFADVILILALTRDDGDGPELRCMAQQFRFTDAPRRTS
jgi:hypothetical protein